MQVEDKQMAEIKDGFVGAVGNTPLIRLHSFSEETGCNILGKSGISQSGRLRQRSGSALHYSRCRRKGSAETGRHCGRRDGRQYRGLGWLTSVTPKATSALIIIPDTQSQEKIDLLRTLGAEVRTVPAVSYKDPNNYVRLSGRIASELDNAIWANQFDNLANQRAHYETTGGEIWNQTDGKVDVWVAATGTGGTYAGVALYLKEKNPDVRCVLADPMGSALYSYAKTGEIHMEGSSITEGIGNSRVTANMENVPIDDAIQVHDSEAVRVVYQLAAKRWAVYGRLSRD